MADRYWIVVEKNNAVIANAYKKTLLEAKQWAEQYKGCKITIFDEEHDQKIESQQQMKLF